MMRICKIWHAKCGKSKRKKSLMKNLQFCDFILFHFILFPNGPAYQLVYLFIYLFYFILSLHPFPICSRLCHLDQFICAGKWDEYADSARQWQ